MTSSTLLWLLLTLTCIAIQAFYSMLEMASISFNKVRLEYYLAKGNKQAAWLNYLITRPSRLFGTTLLGVNVALQVGSECSRHFYASLGLSPGLAAVTQAVLVVIFAELAPMVAGRRYAEHVVMLGIGAIYVSSKVFAPIVWGMGHLSQYVNHLFGKGNGDAIPFSISREEMQKALEDHQDTSEDAESATAFNHISGNIFSVRNKTAAQLMTPLPEIQMAPASASVSQIWHKMRKTTATRLPLYHKARSNIVAIVSPRELLDQPPQRTAAECARPPWFITEDATLPQVLQQFQVNGQSIAVVLNVSGLAIGIVTIEDIVDEIFGEEMPSVKRASMNRDFPLIDRTFPGTMLLSDLNEQYKLSLLDPRATTLSGFVSGRLHHIPERGDTLRLGRLEFTVEEASVREIKSISIRTII